MSVQQYFEENQYVVLEGALDQARCSQLTDYMFDLYKQGKLTKDAQCPQSDAIYGDEVFDKLLSDFALPIGNHVGKKLLPTYTYARIYREGEILKKHTDRSSCEISATLTLGFDSKFNWPIFFNEEKEIRVALEPGDIAVYKGCEICHWRKPFKGNWHVQLFLHYVDADGPYKNHEFDKRTGLGTDSTNKVITNAKQDVGPDVTFRKPLYDGVIIQSKDQDYPGYTSISTDRVPDLMFTKEECEVIVSHFQEAYPSSASVGGGNDGFVRRKIRSADIFNIENTNEYRWIFDKVATVATIVNNNYFDYDLVGIKHGLQLTRYSATDEVPGHYDWHSDIGEGESSTRKISLTVQLTDPDKYKGCNLEVLDHGGLVTAPRDQGAISLFPSYMRHRVTPIEYGERYALVIWIHGVRRFR